MPHMCHARGCDTQIRPQALMCRSHWRHVPLWLQQRLVQLRPAASERSPAYAEALRDAETAVASADPTTGGRIPRTWPALSVRQPWASCILRGGKTGENRTWVCRQELPMWVALHAGGKVWASDPELPAEQRPRALCPWLPEDSAELPRSALLGMMRVVRCSRSTDLHLAGDPWVFRHGEPGWFWEIDAVRVLPEPIPLHGSLGLFKLDPVTAARLEEEAVAIGRRGRA